MKLPRKNIVLGGLLTAALLAATLPAAVRAEHQFSFSDHYLCYETKTNPFDGPTVDIWDQFSFLEGIQITDAARFCNPVFKWHNEQLFEPNDLDRHLTWYRIPRQPGHPVNVTVFVNNQFGEEQRLKLLRPMFLTIPTQKVLVDGEPTEHEQPYPWSTSTCYSVLGRSVKQSVGLADQFQETSKTVMEPLFYCTSNYVQTEGGPEITQSEFPENVQVCYNTRAPRNARETRHTVRIWNWLAGSQDLDLSKSSLLCVPEDSFEPPFEND